MLSPSAKYNVLCKHDEWTDKNEKYLHMKRKKQIIFLIESYSCYNDTLIYNSSTISVC